MEKDRQRLENVPRFVQLKQKTITLIMKNFEKFVSLHNGPEPLLLANVWNVQSAKAFETAGLKAIATSSAAVAETFGYRDGEEMPFEDYLFVIKRIAESTTLPFSVDLEGGYGRDAKTIVGRIEELSRLGVVGINIEDTVVIDGQRALLDEIKFADLLRSIVKSIEAKGINMFINVRSDVYLLGLPEPLAKAEHRARLYSETGVHGIFLPCLTDINHMKILTGQLKLPLNIMCMPDLPSFDGLKKAGVRRISMGNFMNKEVYGKIGGLTAEILDNKNLSPVFP
jgi:2-methylisocitrate lyase-like PEP mutase family enzyme